MNFIKGGRKEGYGIHIQYYILDTVLGVLFAFIPITIP